MNIKSIASSTGDSLESIDFRLVFPDYIKVRPLQERGWSFTLHHCVFIARYTFPFDLGFDEPGHNYFLALLPEFILA